MTQAYIRDKIPAMKNILIIGASSAMGEQTMLLALKSGYKIWATSRNGLKFHHENVADFKMDVCDEESIKNVAQNFAEGQLDAIINFAGIAIAGPVEFLDPGQLQKQFDVTVFGLLKIIQNFYPKLNKKSEHGGRIINVSSMAAFGLFPFISPYSASKSASDILLNSFGIESDTKVVSIKPGVIKTPFWESSLEINKVNFENFSPKYEKEGAFMLKNARKNAEKGLEPIKVAKVILKAINAKNPKASYSVGLDAKIMQFISILPRKLVNSIIKIGLKIRTKK